MFLPSDTAPRAAAWALIALGAVACAAEREPAPRSVVLVTIDTLRADVLGAYGSELGASPALDRLALDGVLFEQSHAAAPSTLPSHASLLTGKRPFRHGVRSNIALQLAEEQRSLAEHLAEAGFATGAEVASIVLAGRTGIDQGFAEFRDTESPDVDIPDPDPGLSREQQLAQRTRRAEDITSRGLEFLEQRAGGPFFLWLHYYDPHWPYAPPEPFATRFSPERSPGALRSREDGPGPVRLQRYAGEVAYVDSQIARLREGLERLGIAERTLLVVTSDHGEGLGEHDEDTHAYYVHQSTMRVPLLLWGPAELPAGVRVSRPVRGVDLAPTVLDWLGQPPLPDADGRSLLPLIEKPGTDEPRLVYGESIELKRVFGAPVLRFLREGRWKYVHKPRPALFDLEQDPDERDDLAARQPERVAELRDRLESLLAESEVTSPLHGEIDPTTAAALQALGYAFGDPQVEIGDEVASLHEGGIDPDDLTAEVRAVSRPWAADGDQAAEVRRLRELSDRFPESSPVLEKLLDAQLGYGLAEEALQTLRRGVELAPDKQRYWSNLAELLVKLGRHEEALAVLPEVLERFPCDHTSRIHLAGYLAQDGDHVARIALLERGLAAECEVPSPELANELAWALASVPDAALRDGRRARALALRAVEALPDDPLVLDTLAAAQAEDGRLDAAIDTMERALVLARSEGLPEPVLDLLREHAEMLRAGRPIRE